MSRLTVFSLCAALAGAVLADSAGAKPAESPQRSLGEKDMSEAIEATVEKVFRKNSPAVVRVEADDELGKVSGTGFFADADGTIYTLSSVVGDGLSIHVHYDGKRIPARLLAKDGRSNVALIKIDGVGATPHPQAGDCSELKPASPVVVIGFPFDHDASPSFGVVGGLDRKSKGKLFTTTHIRANVPVQRGQGGSPAFNLDGEVIGLLVSGLDQGAGGYILPMRAAEKVRADYARYGEVRHGWAGVTLQEIPAAVRGSRMAVDVIDPSGPAASDFRTGDVILQVGDVVIREPEDAIDASFFLTAGEPVNVRVARGDEELSIPFTPADHPYERRMQLQALGHGGLVEPAPSAR